MKFKLYASLSIFAFLAASVVSGAMPLQAAFALLVVSNACLATYNPKVLAACPDYFAGLRIATENLGNEIHRIPSPATPYYNFIQRGTFPKNTGVNQTTFTAGRVEPTSKSAGWSDVSLSNNTVTGGACADSFTEISVGFNETNYAPRKLQLKGPSICKDTLTYAHNPMDFIGNHYVPSLANYVKRKVDLEFRDQVIKLGNKMSIAAGAFSNVFTSTTLPTIKPTSMLTWDWLDGVAARLIGAGATNVDGETLEWGPDGPVFPAFIGLEMLNRIFHNVSVTRTDWNYADMGKGDMAATLRAIGAGRQHKNFRFAPVTHPPRYTWNNSILVEVEAFEDSALDHGTGQVETSAWLNAEYEAVVIPSTKQFKANMVLPESAGLDYDETSYNGDWRFVTGGNRIVTGNVCYDPLHKWGAHFAEFAYAPEPIHTNYGWTLIYKRCANDQQLAICTSGA